MIAAIDDNVGRILDKLEDDQLSDNTIVVFLSDNGGRIGPYPGWETVANNEPLIVIMCQINGSEYLFCFLPRGNFTSLFCTHSA